MNGWHRLHPLSPAVRAARALIAIGFIFLPTLASGGTSSWDVGWHVVALAALIVLGVVSWLVTRWQIDGNDLRIETGLLRRSSLRYPLSQVQAIDTVRPGIARAFGLAELRLRMGGTGGAARLAYLPVAEADELRARLLALSQGAPEET
ncbi:MAG TPA: PH domain-containing protein, partial [Gaiellaceae bacterium]|nr:PH domain-containing protein [Gaiellaceae bacterium]